MVPRSNRDSLLVEMLRDFFVRDAGDDEGQDTCFVNRGADRTESRNGAQRVCGIFEQGMLISGDGRNPHTDQIIDRRPEPDHSGDIRSARFKFLRGVLISGLLESHVPNHMAAALPWRHCLEQRRFSIERSDARGPKDFVSREYEEISVERLDIDRQMWRRLCAIHQHRHPTSVSQCDDFFDWIDGPERVGNMSHGDKLGSRAEQLWELLEDQFTAVIKGHDPEGRASLSGEQLPGYDVRMMFHRGEDDLVARTDIFPTVALGNQIDRLGSSTDEDDFFGIRGTQKLPHFLAAGLEQFR